MIKQISVTNDICLEAFLYVEEWTSSHKVVNHKTKQIETRIQRQIVLEDGKVIADSGPQVTTRTKEDLVTEEHENNEKKPSLRDLPLKDEKIHGKSENKENVVSEKFERHQTTRSAKQENLQFHDETVKHLSLDELHGKFIIDGTGQLLPILNNQSESKIIEIGGGEKINDIIDYTPVKGKLTHYSSKSHKVTDKEEVTEISTVNEEGIVSTETKRTTHHEEISDDEVPDDENVEPLPEEIKIIGKAIESKVMAETNHRITIRDAIKDTDKWVSSHFGSDNETIEHCKTKAGGNRIEIEWTNKQHNGQVSHPLSSKSPNRSPSNLTGSSDHSTNRISINGQIMSQTNGKKQNVSRDEVDSRNNRSSSSLSPSQRFMEDASVQASLSDEEKNAEKIKKSIPNRQNQATNTPSPKPLNGTANGHPKKTFYFGEHEMTLTRSAGKKIATHMTIEKFGNDSNNNLIINKTETVTEEPFLRSTTTVKVVPVESKNGINVGKHEIQHSRMSTSDDSDCRSKISPKINGFHKNDLLRQRMSTSDESEEKDRSWRNDIYHNKFIKRVNEKNYLPLNERNEARRDFDQLMSKSCNNLYQASRLRPSEYATKYDQVDRKINGEKNGKSLIGSQIELIQYEQSRNDRMRPVPISMSPKLSSRYFKQTVYDDQMDSWHRFSPLVTCSELLRGTNGYTASLGIRGKSGKMSKNFQQRYWLNDC